MLKEATQLVLVIHHNEDTFATVWCHNMIGTVWSAQYDRHSGGHNMGHLAKEGSRLHHNATISEKRKVTVHFIQPQSEIHGRALWHNCSAQQSAISLSRTRQATSRSPNNQIPAKECEVAQIQSNAHLKKIVLKNYRFGTNQHKCQILVQPERLHIGQCISQSYLSHNT